MTAIPETIAGALDLFERRRAATDRAYVAATEALTVHFEKLLADLAERYPKRRFRALSGHGGFGIVITPGPHHSLPHHQPYQTYTWNWGGMAGPDRYWSFLWQEWEDLFDHVSQVTGEQYIELTRDFTVTGRHYKGED